MINLGLVCGLRRAQGGCPATAVGVAADHVGARTTRPEKRDVSSASSSSSVAVASGNGPGSGDPLSASTHFDDMACKPEQFLAAANTLSQRKQQDQMFKSITTVVTSGNTSTQVPSINNPTSLAEKSPVEKALTDCAEHCNTSPMQLLPTKAIQDIQVLLHSAEELAQPEIIPVQTASSQLPSDINTVILYSSVSLEQCQTATNPEQCGNKNIESSCGTSHSLASPHTPLSLPDVSSSTCHTEDCPRSIHSEAAISTVCGTPKIDSVPDAVGVEHAEDVSQSTLEPHTAELSTLLPDLPKGLSIREWVTPNTKELQINHTTDIPGHISLPHPRIQKSVITLGITIIVLTMLKNPLMLPLVLQQFVTPEEREHHKRTILKKVPAFEKMMRSLCQSDLSESEFWETYFHLLQIHFSQKDAPTQEEDSTVKLVPSRKRRLDARRRAVEALLCVKEIASDDLKDQIRQGIVARVQGWLFVTGCSMYLLQDPTLFEDMLRNTTLTNANNNRSATLKHFNPLFRVEDHVETPIGPQELHTILEMIKQQLPADLYLPFLPDFVSLLLQNLTVEQSYCVAFLSLYKSFVHDFYFPVNKAQFDQLLSHFQLLVNDHLPNTAQKMVELGVKCSDFSELWFSRLFVSTLSSSTLLRVVDCFLSEGKSIILRAGLAVLLLSSSALQTATNASDFISKLQQYARGIQPTEMIQVAFSFTVKSSETASLEANYEITKNPSDLLSDLQLFRLWKLLPSRYQIMEPFVLFSTKRHGYSLSTLYTMCQGFFPLVMLIHTSTGNLLGAYIADELRILVNQFYGCGETFLFSLLPVTAKYEATRNGPNMMLLVEHKLLAVGGGGGKFGLGIDGDLHLCTSSSCTSFCNEPLNQGGVDFYAVHNQRYDDLEDDQPERTKIDKNDMRCDDTTVGIIKMWPLLARNQALAFASARSSNRRRAPDLGGAGHVGDLPLWVVESICRRWVMRVERAVLVRFPPDPSERMASIPAAGVEETGFSVLFSVSYTLGLISRPETIRMTDDSGTAVGWIGPHLAVKITTAGGLVVQNTKFISVSPFKLFEYWQRTEAAACNTKWYVAIQRHFPMEHHDMIVRRVVNGILSEATYIDASAIPGTIRSLRFWNPASEYSSESDLLEVFSTAALAQGSYLFGFHVDLNTAMKNGAIKESDCVAKGNLSLIGVSVEELCHPLCVRTLGPKYYLPFRTVTANLISQHKLLDLSTGTITTWLEDRTGVEVKAVDDTHLGTTTADHSSTSVFDVSELCKPKQGHQNVPCLTHQHPRLPLLSVVAGCGLLVTTSTRLAAVEKRINTGFNRFQMPYRNVTSVHAASHTVTDALTGTELFEMSLARLHQGLLPIAITLFPSRDAKMD
ncbi:TBC1 domain family member 24 [Pelomyxa schiedti]|nr:TBC1 domain family member 24 [Pelomyxa schiedti]